MKTARETMRVKFDWDLHLGRSTRSEPPLKKRFRRDLI